MCKYLFQTANFPIYFGHDVLDLVPYKWSEKKITKEVLNKNNIKM